MKLAATKYFPLAALLLLAVGFVFSDSQENGSVAADNKLAITVGEPSEITMAPTTLDATFKKTAEGAYVTSQNTISLNVSVSSKAKSPGKLVLLGNNRTLKEQVIPDSSAVQISGVSLLENRTNTISARFTSDDNSYVVTSNAISIACDTVGPMLQHAEVIDAPATGITLVITFDNGDFDEASALVTDAFVVLREKTKGVFTAGDQMSIQGTPVIVGNTIRLAFAALPAGQFQLTVAADKLKDSVGNFAGEGAGDSAGKAKTWVFSVLARKFGEHIEFPPFAPPTKQTIPPEGFNPGDVVETRVARLYYYRDAHRVAQIINRNIRSYNQAAVTQAERRAETSRDDADRLTDERRENERAAVRAAQQARNAESKLAAAAQDIGAARSLQAEIDRKTILSADLQRRLTAANAAAKAATDAQAAAQTAIANVITAENLADEKATFGNDAYLDSQTALREQQLAQKEVDTLPDLATPEEKLLKAQKLKERKNEAATAGNKFNSAKRAADSAEADAAFARRERDRLVAVYERKAAEADAVATATGADRLKAEKEQLDLEIEIHQKQLDRLGGSVQGLTDTIESMEQSVGNLRQTEIAKQEAWDKSEAKEARARAKQFRDEVSAAEEDPDTYVAGDIHSVDPVTQVSISVIGEGLIQLRGPIKGINKVRTMINQIDSPVGQIKIGIFTVQVNGEKGDKMEKVVGDAESNIDLSRFLVNHSLELLRKAIQAEAASIAAQCDTGGHYQVDRDRRYLYAFFGRDFIDELYAMNSEFLSSENKVLSLHAMDTVSLNRALFILALAKNDVRERIVARFLESGKTELADAEYDFRRSSELKPHTTQKKFPPWDLTHLPYRNNYKQEEKMYEAVHRNAMQRYHFRNLSGFFDTGFVNPDTMNPMQREFIRLAQIFKAQLVAEMELKQRVLERGLIEDRSNDENSLYGVLSGVRDKAYKNLQEAYEGMLESTKRLQIAAETFDEIKTDLITIPSIEKIEVDATYLLGYQGLVRNAAPADRPKVYESFYDDEKVKEVKKWFTTLNDAKWLTSEQRDMIRDKATEVYQEGKVVGFPSWSDATNMLATQIGKWKRVQDETFPSFERTVLGSNTSLNELDAAYDELINNLNATNQFSPEGTASNDTEFGKRILEISGQLYQDKSTFLNREAAVDYVKTFLKETRAPLDHRKLLNHMIDEQEDKFIELVEGTRSHIAVMDGYLKRLSIALEDDFKVQFYDPMFVRVRDAARSVQVNLGQVERTTILTNNRAFAKVDPQATMEFDLPKRQIAIKEAFDAAKALVEDTGALVNDPTFLAAFQMMGGSTQPTTVKNVIPGQSTSTDQQNMGMVPQPEEAGAPGSALQSLVPEPAIYKLETGTGFQIRPVMQPDGDSVVYDFDYMYTTNIREPVRADEKHIGRIKRHFVHTAVQTGNYELREISRYQVALKVSRTSQGVPLLQDIPLLGAAFRPAPSAESSIQQNIILGQTNVYPTLFDLMGLRWAQQVVDLDHTSLLESEHVVRGRQKSMRDYVFKVASERVDEFLDIGAKAPDSYRPDFYHSQTLASPHHPGGYFYPYGAKDPTGNGFERIDRRPQDMQEPPYDRYRHQPVTPERISPHAVPESIPLNRSQMDQESIEFRGPGPIPIESSSRRDLRLSPQFNESTYRDSGRGRDSAVVPVRFDQSERPRRDVQMRRLPPVR